MNENNFNNLPEVGKHGQHNIQFDVNPLPKIEVNTIDSKTLAEEAYKKEKMEVAVKFNILNTDGLVKKEDGKWYFLNMTVEDYDELMSDNDNQRQYSKDRENAEEIKKINSDLKRFRGIESKIIRKGKR